MIHVHVLIYDIRYLILFLLNRMIKKKIVNLNLQSLRGSSYSPSIIKSTHTFLTSRTYVVLLDSMALTSMMKKKTQVKFYTNTPLSSMYNIE